MKRRSWVRRVVAVLLLSLCFCGVMQLSERAYAAGPAAVEVHGGYYDSDGNFVETWSGETGTTTSTSVEISKKDFNFVFVLFIIMAAAIVVESVLKLAMVRKNAQNQNPEQDTHLTPGAPRLRTTIPIDTQEFPFCASCGARLPTGARF